MKSQGAQVTLTFSNPMLVMVPVGILGNDSKSQLAWPAFHLHQPPSGGFLLPITEHLYRCYVMRKAKSQIDVADAVMKELFLKREFSADDV